MNTRSLFILRRACLVGRVKRADVTATFDVSGTTAKLDMEAAAAHWPSYLVFTPSHGVTPIPFAAPPLETSSSVLMDLMQQGAPAHAMGLTQYEPVIAYATPRYVYQGAVDRPMAMHLIRACLTRQVMDIDYVGMRRGEERRVRTVLPLGLELLGQQWRLIACDVDAKQRVLGSEQKAFVLARIGNAQAHMALHGKTLKTSTGQRVDARALCIDRQERTYQVWPNRQLTTDQLEAIVREFALERRNDAHVIRMPERNAVEFRRDHCTKQIFATHADPLADYVSPIFEDIQPYAIR
ncbi:WYL domain-containing protein [Lampropedia puyangensis]|uniref:WYL domain-containing protein n=1 Tax=Lampropedia puyangensis TaxID=1330072 RepID=A0A4S8FDJ9_9BURK|nr:WYL domain-containing protein [Lampropedia puyangensis]THU03992.1 WYL domain-containing protein [Lampropedia puyangensis]